MKSHFFEKLLPQSINNSVKNERGEKKKNHWITPPHTHTAHSGSHWKTPSSGNCSVNQWRRQTCDIKPHCKVLRLRGGCKLHQNANKVTHLRQKMSQTIGSWGDTDESRRRAVTFWLGSRESRRFSSLFCESASQRTANFHMYKLLLIHNNKSHYTPGWVFSCN